ncbi:MAG: hypothetical protein ACR2IE_09860 [Candidatus Sumerlaeaceae bacterium]
MSGSLSIEDLQAMRSDAERKALLSEEKARLLREEIKVYDKLIVKAGGVPTPSGVISAALLLPGQGKSKFHPPIGSAKAAYTVLQRVPSRQMEFVKLYAECQAMGVTAEAKSFRAVLGSKKDLFDIDGARVYLLGGTPDTNDEADVPDEPAADQSNVEPETEENDAETNAREYNYDIPF